MNKETLNKLILFILIPVQLFLFTFLPPPFQKPDEQVHFEKALLISKGYLFCQKNSNNTILIEKKYSDFIKTPYLDLLTHEQKTKLPLQRFFKDLFSNNNSQSNKKISYNIDRTCSFPIISYLPQAFILMITSQFNPFISLYLGRLAMSILGYFWFLYLYQKIQDKYKLILLFTFALPMTLHQISSFSYDAINIMLALTFFTLIINMRKDVIKIFLVLFLLIWSKKIGYETFALFLFLIPFSKKQIIYFISLFIPLYALSKLNGSYDLQSSLSQPAINPVKQLNFLFSNPTNIMKVIVETTIQRLGFYLQSLIGIFGWLEYGLDHLSYFLYGLFFVYVIVEARDVSSLRRNKNILLFITLIISYIFIVLLAFVFNTTPGQTIAHGVQGRYFIPFLPFIILLIIQLTQKIKYPKIQVGELLSKIIYLLIIGYLISATFYSVFSRYY